MVLSLSAKKSAAPDVAAEFTEWRQLEEINQIEYVDFHLHGCKSKDFSSALIDGTWIDAILAADVEAEKSRQFFVPSIFLAKNSLEQLEDACAALSNLWRDGRATRILGIGVEGPALGSRGGTPREASWTPSLDQWQRISRLGSLGLVFCVMSFSDDHDRGFQDRIFSELFAGGVTPALGHFKGRSIEALLSQIDRAIDIGRSGQRRVLSDHLFNDMPLSFRHAWRSGADRTNRTDELMRLARCLRTTRDVENVLGAVPARMIFHAWRGNITLCVNFDGAHVDLGVLKVLKTLMPTESLIAMTDRVELDKLSNESLAYNKEDTLYYNKQGIVAAGSSTMAMQAFNLFQIGYSVREIQTMTHMNARAFSAQSPRLG